MKKRKLIQLNKTYQTKKAFGFIVIVAVIAAIFIVSIGVFLTLKNNEINQNNERIMETIEQMKKIMELQQNVYINLSIRPTDPTQGMIKEAAETAKSNYNSSMDALTTAIESNESLVESNNKTIQSNISLLLACTLICMIGVAILYWRLLAYTHRTAGPIAVMTKDIQKILNGQKPDFRDLRARDDFKEFYTLLKTLAQKYLDLEKKTQPQIKSEK